MGEYYGILWNYNYGIFFGENYEEGALGLALAK